MLQNFMELFPNVETICMPIVIITRTSENILCSLEEFLSQPVAYGHVVELEGGVCHGYGKYEDAHGHGDMSGERSVLMARCP